MFTPEVSSVPWREEKKWKMTFRRPTTDIESDASTLLHYESLRSQVLNKLGSFYERSMGLTLFIRRGMLAWIEACQRSTPSNWTANKPKQTPVFRYGATSEMIKVMANITLCNLEEALS
jgi:hypothetical protein